MWIVYSFENVCCVEALKAVVLLRCVVAIATLQAASAGSCLAYSAQETETAVNEYPKCDSLYVQFRCETATSTWPVNMSSAMGSAVCAALCESRVSIPFSD